MPNERIHCDHASRCGGCPILDLSYDEQLALKGSRAAQALARYPELCRIAREPVVAAQPIVGYRTRAKLVVGADGSLGLFAKGGGHHVVDIPLCRVISSPLTRVADVLRGLIRSSEPGLEGLRRFDPSGDGALRAVDLREVNEGETSLTARVLVTLVIARCRAPSLALLEIAARELMRMAPEVIGVAANFHEGEAPQMLGAETRTLAGAASVPDRVGASVHYATFGSFVQAHRGQAGRVHALLGDAVGLPRPPGAPGRAPRVLDLYGGSGSIALWLAGAGAKVTLVESFAPAVVQAAAAARAQGLEIQTVCADVASGLATLRERRERFDAAVVNPPRRGTSAAVRNELAKLTPRLVAYVSCDPETLARDLAHFARLGYEATSVTPFDMIPLTEEVEAVALLRRASVPAPRVVYEDAEALVIDKSAHESTASQGDPSESLLARVRRLPGAEEAVAVQQLDVETSGLVIFARTGAHFAMWRRALEAGTTRERYAAAVRGVTPSKGVAGRDLGSGGGFASGRTRYRRLGIAAGHSLLRVTPEPGRTDLIRRHLASIGHPVLGDRRHGHAPTNRYFEEKTGLDRMFLHCVRLEVEHPDRRTRLVLDAPVPGELRAVLERMGGVETLELLDKKNALG